MVHSIYILQFIHLYISVLPFRNPTTTPSTSEGQEKEFKLLFTTSDISVVDIICG